MFASAEAEPGSKVEHRRVVETHVGQKPVAATTQTLGKVFVVAFETFALEEEQNAFTSAETPKKKSSDRISRNICAPFFNAGVMWEEVCSYSFTICSSGPAWRLLGVWKAAILTECKIFMNYQ